MTLKAPFPYFGGKSKVAPLIWERFGVVNNYVEPFFGSGAVLLARPDFPCLETVNDVDGFVANFWRAIALNPAEVAHWADWPVIENDLEARHAWLVARKERLKWSLEDPDFYDAKIAGWWVWGLSAWIGSGWCSGDGPHYHDGAHFGPRETGRGISKHLPYLSSAGTGIHSESRRGGGISRQSMDLCGGKGIHRRSQGGAGSWVDHLAKRLRRVRVLCGDWSRVCGHSVTFKNGLTAMFLDPPYAGEDISKVYAHDSAELAHDVAKWAIENGNNPLMRICVAGYSGTHEFPDGWTAVNWKAAGGYGLQGDGQGRENAKRETLWFSPHCLAGKQASLFG